MTDKYQVVVIGSGPGGYVAAIRAAQLGFKTACIEKRKTLGGTCLNVGCIPSKTLLESSHQYALIKEKGAELGIKHGEIGVDFPQMMARKDKVVEGLVNGVAGLLKKNKIDWISGEARFLTEKTLEVTSEGVKTQVEADFFILATGSESIDLPFLPIDEKQIVTSTGALSLQEIPKKMIVIGAGVIGVELASVYARLGAEVSVIEMLEVICPTLDADLSKALLQTLKKQGITFHLGAKVTQCEKKDNQVFLDVVLKEQTQKMNADVVMVAIGRRPYSKGLNLQGIGVELDSKGFVVIDGNFRTKVPHIYAIGDLVDGPMLAHKASDEGVAVAEIIAHQSPLIEYLAIPNVIYTHPEVAVVGMTEKDAKDLGLAVISGKAFFKGNARARCADDAEGYVKILGEEKTHRILGLHMIGPHVSEMICEGVLAIKKKATLEDIACASHAHPTLSESIKEAAQDALKMAMH